MKIIKKPKTIRLKDLHPGAEFMLPDEDDEETYTALTPSDEWGYGTKSTHLPVLWRATNTLLHCPDESEVIPVTAVKTKVRLRHLNTTDTFRFRPEGSVYMVLPFTTPGKVEALCMSPSVGVVVRDVNVMVYPCDAELHVEG